MTARPVFDGSRQRLALTKLQERSGRAPTDIASELGLSDPQYRRYVWGKLPLRVDQFEPFARAYGVAVRLLVDLIVDDAIDPAWDFRAYLREAGIPEGDIEGWAEQWEGRGILDQKAGAEGIVRLFREARDRQNRPA